MWETIASLARDLPRLFRAAVLAIVVIIIALLAISLSLPALLNAPWSQSVLIPIVGFLTGTLLIVAIGSLIILIMLIVAGLLYWGFRER